MQLIANQAVMIRCLVLAWFAVSAFLVKIIWSTWCESFVMLEDG